MRSMQGIVKEGDKELFKKKAPYTPFSFFKKHPQQPLKQKIYYCPVCSKAGKRKRVLTCGEYCNEHSVMKEQMLKRRGYMG